MNDLFNFCLNQLLGRSILPPLTVVPNSVKADTSKLVKVLCSESTKWYILAVHQLRTPDNGYNTGKTVRCPDRATTHLMRNLPLSTAFFQGLWLCLNSSGFVPMTAPLVCSIGFGPSWWLTALDSNVISWSNFIWVLCDPKR